MLRLRFNFLIILIIIFSYAIEELTIFQEEVVDTTRFTEYYSYDNSNDQGEQILSTNYFTTQRDYYVDEDGTVKKQISESEGETEVEAENVEKESVEKEQVRDVKKVTYIEYFVKKGDALSLIADEYNITEEMIKINNPKNAKVLRVGDKLKIPSENGLFYKVKKGDSLFKIAQRYGVKINDIRRYNSLENDELDLNQEIFIKNPSIKIIRKQLIESNPVPKKSNLPKPVSGFTMPIKYTGVNSPYGTRFHPVLKRYIMHAGVDLKARYIPFRAAQKGTVIYSGYKSGYGKIIMIQHEGGYETRYAHLQNMNVSKGDVVQQGQIIGLTGNSGRSTGPHLHYEVRKDGRTIDPLKATMR